MQLVDVEKIIVGDRIRKDYGDLEELAEDISENTLFNALVATPSGNGDGTYVLIAGERRLRAMRDILDYKAVPVNIIGARDAEHALLMEISENECRKEFTKTERLDYARKLARIEAVKAKERQGTRTDIGADLRESARTDETVADTLGTSASQIRREQFISDNRELLDPADFADWDEGRLSTNKAFQRIKAAKEQAERERDEARKDAEEVSELYGKVIVQRDEAKEDLASERAKNLELGSQIANLRHQVSEKPEPEVIEREVEVVREVVPEDVQKRIRDLEHEQRIYLDTDRKLRNRLRDVRKELDRAKGIIGMDKGTRDVQRDVEYLISATNQYVRHYGGLTWTFERIADVDDVTRDELRKAVKNLATFSNALVASLEQMQ